MRIKRTRGGGETTHVPETVSLSVWLSEGPTRDRGCRGTDGTPANCAVTVSRNDTHGTQRMGFNNTFVVWLETHDIKSIIHLLLWNTGLDWILDQGKQKIGILCGRTSDWLRYIRLIARGNNVCTGWWNMEHGVLLIWLESWEVFI